MAFRDFKVPWKAKALAFKVMDRMPFGDGVHYLFQRYVTRTIPRTLSPTIQSARSQLLHVQAFESHGLDLARATLLEFGAGWDLYSNVLLYCYGADRQIAVDVRRLVSADAVNAVIAHLRDDPPPNARRAAPAFVRKAHVEDDLRGLGIEYRAPVDAGSLDLPGDSIDAVLTTSVLEHVPPDAISEMLRECRRIVRPGGLMSHVVDYSDHYAHSDGDINEYNYLSYSDAEWARFNPSIHFQNRMRTRFYRRQFEDHGFAICAAAPWSGGRKDLERVSVAADFSHYHPDELLELGCHFVVAKQDRGIHGGRAPGRLDGPR